MNSYSKCYRYDGIIAIFIYSLAVCLWMDMYNGLINVYKEPGYTSFDVVAVLRGILKQKKIGHTGTLDPAAEGVLLVCLGSGTKLCDMLDNHEKEYRCRMLLGQVTDTDDTTGQVLESKEVNVSEEAVRQAVLSFLGQSLQIPPMYSAIKQNGKKLYELARSGQVVERKARPINVSKIEIEEISLPYVTFSVQCSKGTYIRSICRDIGEKLGCGGTMEHLVRTSASGYTIDEALKLEDIRNLEEQGMLGDRLVSVEQIFRDFKALYVKEEAAKYIDNGNPMMLIDFTTEPDCVDGQMFRIYNTSGKFVAVYKYSAERELLVPEKMFLNQE